MNSNYYQQVEDYLQEIRERVKITAIVGEEALEAAKTQKMEEEELRENILDCVRFNPNRGRANDVKQFTKICEQIISLELPYRPLDKSLEAITKLALDPRYNIRDRRAIIAGLKRVKNDYRMCTPAENVLIQIIDKLEQRKPFLNPESGN